MNLAALRRINGENPLFTSLLRKQYAGHAVNVMVRAEEFDRSSSSAMLKSVAFTPRVNRYLGRNGVRD